MLASISSRTSTRSNANTMTSNAGTRVSQCKSKADENNPPISVMLLALVETAALAEPAVAAALAAPNPEPPLARSRNVYHTTQHKRHRTRAQHAGNSIEQVRMRKLFDQQGTGGNRRTTIAHIDARKNRATEHHRVRLHRQSQRHADGAHSRRTGERRPDQHRHRRAQ